MENQRILTISLDTATEWYLKGGDLAQLALNVFSKDEIEDYIRKRYFSKSCPVMMYVPEKSVQMFEILSFMASAAEHLNGEGWEKKNNETAYFIVFNENYTKYTICNHFSATYFGIIYFKCKKDAEIVAIQILESVKFHKNVVPSIL